MPISNKTEWYGVNAAVVRKTDNITEYSIACDTPNGKMKVFHLFPGIDYAETSFKTALCDYRKQTAAEVVEIAYCKAGRFECEYQSGYFTYIGEGDCAVGILEAQTETPYFPLDYYTGCAVIIDLNITGTFFRTAVEGISINLNALLQKFCPGSRCTVFKTPDVLRRVFEDLYEISRHSDYTPDQTLGYLRIKVLELFFLLSEYQADKPFYSSECFSGIYIKKVKAIKTDITENLYKKIRLKELSKKYNIGVTMLKNCFKAVYGKPVFVYRKEYKMQAAARLLKMTDKSVTEIAALVGYENPNKFSSAFKEIFSRSPREYRKE